VPGQAASETPAPAPTRPAFAVPTATVPVLHVLHDGRRCDERPGRGDASSAGDLGDVEKSGARNDACQCNLLTFCSMTEVLPRNALNSDRFRPAATMQARPRFPPGGLLGLVLARSVFWIAP
jgi:hypothetical protein